MKKLIRYMVGCIGLLVCLPSLANFSVQLTRSMDSAMHIGVEPFSTSKVMAVGNQTLSQIVQNDLQNSGEFWVSSHAPQSLQQWAKQRIKAVLQGSLSHSVTGGYDLSVSLYVWQGSVVPTKATWQHEYHADQGQLRHMAHQVSDKVYQTLTGMHGWFATRLAYVVARHQVGAATQYSLRIADVDGFNEKTLLQGTQPIMSPSFSADGKELAYVSYEQGQPAVYVEQLSTGQRQAIAAFSGLDSAPVFSPDGQSLAMVLIRNGSPKIMLYQRAAQSWQQLTQGSSVDSEPYFSPDGQNLLFSSDRQGGVQIFEYNLQSKQVKRLTFSGSYNAHAQYLPSGQSIVFMHRQGGMGGIARLRLGAAKPRVIVRSEVARSPSVSPYGQMVVYVTRFAGRGVMAMASLDGHVRLRLPDSSGDVEAVAW